MNSMLTRLVYGRPIGESPIPMEPCVVRGLSMQSTLRYSLYIKTHMRVIWQLHISCVRRFMFFRQCKFRFRCKVSFLRLVS